MGLWNWLEKRIDLSDKSTYETIIGEIHERLSTKALAFYIATSYVADTISKCEIKRYVNGKAVKDELYYLLNVSPNMNQNATEFKVELIFKLFNSGEALVFSEKDQLYLADNFNRYKFPIKGDVFSNISLKDESTTFERLAEDVFYFNLDDGKLKSLVSSMLDDYAEILNYAFEIYKDSNGEKYVLDLANIQVGDKDFNEKFNTVIKKQLESFINSRKAVYPQFKGQKLEKFKEANEKTDSSDIRELRKEIFEITAEAFKMPVSMLYGNMTNVKDIISSYVTFRIDPLAKLMSDEFTRKTGKFEDYENGTYVDVDTTAVIHHDIFEIAPDVDKLLASGVYSIDGILEKLGEPPLNTDFSKQHWITKNYSKIEDALTGENETMGSEV